MDIAFATSTGETLLQAVATPLISVWTWFFHGPFGFVIVMGISFGIVGWLIYKGRRIAHA